MCFLRKIQGNFSRSREGAWIEIFKAISALVFSSRSREGAWIEIMVSHRQTIQDFVAPARERGLKLLLVVLLVIPLLVAPARERGLKF